MTVDERLVEAKAYAANAAVTSKPHIPSVSATAVLGESETLPASTPQCIGHNFNSDTTLDSLMASMMTTGFQATQLGLAMEQIQQMRQWRLSDTPWREGDDEALQSITVRSRIRARIFFAYTSNQISSGQREVIRYLLQHKMVDVVVTTAGGIEEDIIKCFHPTFLGDFKLSGRELRKKGINRIGNLLVPNMNYCAFEDWVTPLINQMHDEQDAADREWAQQVAARDASTTDSLPAKFVWTPSKVIHRLGKEINNEESVLYWAGACARSSYV